MSFNWRSFIYNINNNGVVPVIGNDLSMVRFLKEDLTRLGMSNSFIESGVDEGDSVTFNLYDYLASRLWDIYGVGEPPIVYTIDKVVLQLHKQHVLDNDINNAIKNEVSNLTDEQIFLEPFRKLAEITGFDTILTVNPDNFLERAFEAAEIPVNESVNYSIPLPALDQNKKQDRALVSIYNLMGNIQGYNFALTEEQSLEYLHMLQKGEDTICKDLFDAIKDKAILLIGCSFPDWFMRFFIRIIAKERFKNGIKTKYVACDHTLQDIELSYFLEHNATKVIRIAGPTVTKEGLTDGDKVYRDSIEFIDEMHRVWKEYRGDVVDRIRFKEKVFLSYSWDDKSVVERLKNEFEKNGISVFFDDDAL
ncbi:MAG: toll/interleukin-1 receptor domain-containing protein, partial [Pricia sp.]|nr:toll/interleukin-1 receptor domain-containing protein [Pricia sp.]